MLFLTLVAFLALLVPTNGDEELLNKCHVAYLLNDDYPPPDEGFANMTCRQQQRH